MELGEYGPWLIVGGYAVAVALLALGIKTDGRWPLVAKVSVTGAALVASATTLYWLTLGTFSGPFMYVWSATPIVLVALVWARRYRQGEWMDRMAGRTGSYWNEDRPGHPNFGVLPAQGRAVAVDDERAGFVSAVEVELHGHQVLGVQYGYGQGPRGLGRKKSGRFDQAIDIAESTYCAVELRTPEVPSLVIVPRSGPDRQAEFGVDGAGDVRPFEDARLTRNSIGMFTPSGVSAAEGIVGDEFNVRFAVRTSDPEFARSVLTAEVQRHILDDPWFRVRQVAWHGGALYTSDAGQLAETVLLANARHLAQLAAVVPGQAWRYAGQQAERFVAASRATDTSTAAWYRGRRSLTTTINERRVAANRVPLSPWSIVVRVSLVAILLLIAVAAVADTGADPDDAVRQIIIAVLFFGGSALVLAKVSFLPKVRKPDPHPVGSDA